MCAAGRGAGAPGGGRSRGGARADELWARYSAVMGVTGDEMPEYDAFAAARASRHQTKKAPPSASIALDDCEYNAMHKEDCELQGKSFERDVKTAHFTQCQKPWACHHGMGSFCDAMTDAWWTSRQSLEEENGMGSNYER